MYKVGPYKTKPFFDIFFRVLYEGNFLALKGLHMKFKNLIVAAILLSLYTINIFWPESSIKQEKKQPIAVSSDSVPSSNGLNEWAYENPLDLNYALVQRRIDSILNGEREVSESKKQLKEDAEFLTMLTQINPPLPPVFSLLGQVELLLQDYTKAEQAFVTYVSLEPEDIWGWRLLALSQMGLGDYNAAIDTFKEVIKINPVDLSAWKSLGKIYQNEGHLDLAIAAYEKALLMSPDDPEVNRALEGLK